MAYFLAKITLVFIPITTVYITTYQTGRKYIFFNHKSEQFSFNIHK